MKIWTRKWQEDGTRKWIEVTGNQAIIAWLQNVLLLQLGEEPFYADWGIPVTQTLANRYWPDYYLNLIQQRFADQVSFIKITPERSDNDPGTEPLYSISIIFNDGTFWNSQNKFNQSFSQTGPN